MPRGAQSSMMEYLILSFFILLIIISLIMMLTWWQISQINLEQQEQKSQRTVQLLEMLSSSTLLVQKDSVFDGSRLQAAQSLRGEACDALEVLFGSGWYLEVEVLDPEPGSAGPCTGASYPDCSSWTICPEPGSPRNISRILPVNVYRKAWDRTDIALMRTGVYT